jgi:hypothetical protein
LIALDNVIETLRVLLVAPPRSAAALPLGRESFTMGARVLLGIGQLISETTRPAMREKNASIKSEQTETHTLSKMDGLLSVVFGLVGRFPAPALGEIDVRSRRTSSSTETGSCSSRRPRAPTPRPSGVKRSRWEPVYWLASVNCCAVWALFSPSQHSLEAPKNEANKNKLTLSKIEGLLFVVFGLVGRFPAPALGESDVRSRRTSSSTETGSCSSRRPRAPTPRPSSVKRSRWEPVYWLASVNWVGEDTQDEWSERSATTKLCTTLQNGKR